MQHRVEKQKPGICRSLKTRKTEYLLKQYEMPRARYGQKLSEPLNDAHHYRF
jgi:hypothetical protein